MTGSPAGIMTGWIYLTTCLIEMRLCSMRTKPDLIVRGVPGSGDGSERKFFPA